jgi:hypothetical protein
MESGEQAGRGGWLPWAVGAAVVVGVVAALATRATKDPGEGDADGYRLEAIQRRTLFVELVYEVGPDELGKAVRAEDYDAPTSGYALHPDPGLLYAREGRDVPTPDGLLVGRRMRFPAAGEPSDRTDWGDLVVPAAGWRWKPADEPDPAKVALGGVDTIVRVPVEVAARRHEAEDVIFEMSDSSARVAPGESAVVWSGSLETTVAEYGTRASARVPNLPAQATASPALAEALGADAQGRVTVHARLVAVHRGFVNLVGLDLRTAGERAREAARRGAWEEAEALLRFHLAALPSEGWAGDLLARVETDRARGAKRVRLSGKVTGVEGDGPPVHVAARRAEDPERQYFERAAVRDGRYELFLPPGSYEVVATGLGAAPASRAMELQGDSTWDVEVRRAGR